MTAASNPRKSTDSAACRSESQPVSDGRKLRILFAPSEVCGQMQLLAEHFRLRGHEALAVNYGEPHPFAQPNDRNLCLSKKSRLARFLRSLAFAMWAIPRYDVFHFFEKIFKKIFF